MSIHIAKRAVLVGGVTYPKHAEIPDNALTDEQWERLARQGAILTKPSGDEDDDLEDIIPETECDGQAVDDDPSEVEDEDPGNEDNAPETEDDDPAEEEDASAQTDSALMEALNVTGENTVVDGAPVGDHEERSGAEESRADTTGADAKPARAKRGARANAS